MRSSALWAVAGLGTLGLLLHAVRGVGDPGRPEDPPGSPPTFHVKLTGRIGAESFPLGLARIRVRRAEREGGDSTAWSWGPGPHLVPKTGEVVIEGTAPGFVGRVLRRPAGALTEVVTMELPAWATVAVTVAGAGAGARARLHPLHAASPAPTHPEDADRARRESVGLELEGGRADFLLVRPGSAHALRVEEGSDHATELIPPLRPGETRQVDLQLRPCARIRGALPGPSGAAWKLAVVRIGEEQIIGRGGEAGFRVRAPEFEVSDELVTGRRQLIAWREAPDGRHFAHGGCALRGPGVHRIGRLEMPATRVILAAPAEPWPPGDLEVRVTAVRRTEAGELEPLLICDRMRPGEARVLRGLPPGPVRAVAFGAGGEVSAVAHGEVGAEHSRLVLLPRRE